MKLWGVILSIVLLSLHSEAELVGRLGRYGFEIVPKVWGVGKERVLGFKRKPLESMRRPYEPGKKGRGEATWWLCFSADWADMRLGTASFRVHHDGWDVGPLYLLRVSWIPKGAKVGGKSWKVSWTTLELSIDFETRLGRNSLDIVASVLSPALLLRVKGPSLSLRRSDLPVSGRAEATSKEITAHEAFFKFAAAPLREGVRIFDLSKPVKIVSLQDELSEPWLLLWCGGSPEKPESTPLLLALEKRPHEVKWDGEGLEVVRPDGVGRGALMPFYGTDFSSDDDHRRGRDWNAAFFDRLERVRSSPPPDVLPQRVLDRIRFWTRALRAFPIACREEFKVLNDKVEIRDRYEFEVMEGDFDLEPLRLAPLPPILSLAKGCGYPIEFCDGVETFDLPTFFGPYTARPASSEVSYSLPIPPWGEFPAVNVPGLLDGLKMRISSEVYNRPFGHHWDACGTSWRIASNFLAFPILDKHARHRLIEDAKKTFGAYVFTDWKWTHYHDPNFGYRWLIHAVGKPFQKFETEWANGLVLCGVAAYLAYTGDTGTIRRYWDYVKGAFDFFATVHDWATMWTSSDGTGNQLGSGIDPMSAGYSGVSAYAVITKIMGEEEEHKRALYILAKGCVPSALRYLYLSYKELFWRWTCDLNWTPSEEADEALLTGWGEDGTHPLRLSQWMWGITYHLFPAWPDLIASFIRFSPEEFREVEERKLPEIHGKNWFEGPPKGNFDRPQHADLHVISLSILRSEPPRKLLSMLRRAALPQRFLKPWDVAAILSSPAEAWPLIRGRYFIEGAEWFPESRALHFFLGGRGRRTVYVKALSKPRKVLVNGKSIPFRYDDDRKVLSFEASLPAEVTLLFRRTRSMLNGKSGPLRFEVKNTLDFERTSIAEIDLPHPPSWPGPVVELLYRGGSLPGQISDAEFDDEKPRRFRTSWICKLPPKGEKTFTLKPSAPGKWSSFDVRNPVQKGWLSDEFEIVKGDERVLMASQDGGLLMTMLLRGEPFSGRWENGVRAGLTLLIEGLREGWESKAAVKSAVVARRGPVFCDIVCPMTRWWGYFRKKLDVSFEGRVFKLPEGTTMRCRWEITPADGVIKVLPHSENGEVLRITLKGALKRGTFEVEGSPGVYAFDGRKVFVGLALPPDGAKMSPEWSFEGDAAVLRFEVKAGAVIDRRIELLSWIGLIAPGDLQPREAAELLSLSLMKRPW